MHYYNKDVPAVLSFCLGVGDCMGWTHIPDMYTGASTSDDNPFTGPKAQPAGKVSVTMPTNEWLCSKMGKLNLTLTEGYLLRSSEAGGLLKDQFVRPPGLRRNGMALYQPNRKLDRILARLYLLGVRMHPK